MIFFVLKVILFEHSKYSNTLQNVWYCIFLGNDFHNWVFVLYVLLDFMAFSTISIVCKFGSCITFVMGFLSDLLTNYTNF